ncbi:MAG: 6-carboxyhexanoate--CoA ligase [Nitrospirae bacterium]|nr:6-carboxyhexanoate--CoA ligase [Nitrospirota bacterium]
MRASKKVRCKSSSSTCETHISGAEGIYEDEEKPRIAETYIKRALSHPRGKPDTIVITFEKIRHRPKTIPALPVITLECETASAATAFIKNILQQSGISEEAVRQGMKIVRGRQPMRGAALVLSESGRRVEPDRKRGVRASRFGTTRRAEKALSLRLAEDGINTETVKEALILASKVASHRQVVAELCVSDDPDYTTGYVASRRFGYIRIPSIKKMGNRAGGRVFFVKEDAAIDALIHYLSETPVMIGK